MDTWKRSKLHLILTILLLSAAIVPFATPSSGLAEPIANDPFQHTWERTDKPVADGAVSRTWMWGPEAFTDAKIEDYAESPNGQRAVQYFDKSRMEITHPGDDQSSIWYVTNGLLVVELMSGRMQTGDNTFVDRAPAQINVAGDPDDPLTYAVMAGLRDDAPLTPGEKVVQRVDASGQVSDDASLAHYGVTAVTHVSETNHTVASPFWEFMTSSGTVYQDGGATIAPLFDSPYYATGLPITEAYWATVKVGGEPHEVLLQCFERRCLTYTPGNPDGWQVEAGNVGQHYYRWRYTEIEPGPSASANSLASAVMNAQDDQARATALMGVLGALNVGVYTGQGQQLLGGAERGAGDFYLYDAEVQMMAGAIGRQQTLGLVDLAMQLTAIGFYTEEQPLDPNVLYEALLTAAQQAEENPDAAGSLPLLLARQMGLAASAPFDLFDDPSLDQIRLDPLSFFLLLADISVPLVEDELPATAGTSNLIEMSDGVLQRAEASTPCDPASIFNGDAFKNAWGFTKNFADLLGVIPEAIGKASAVLDAIHGAVLAFSVGVTSLDSRLETQYGDGGPGQPITFRVKVEMRDDLPQALIDCGWIVGTDYPAKGPIKGVSVHWFWPGLDQHGQSFCGNACPNLGESGISIDATGDDGIAKMTFTPKEDPHPDDGTLVEDQGIVTGVALYQSHFTNLLGSYMQYLTPKSGTTRWVVRWHEIPGWDVTMHVTWNFGGTSDSQYLVQSSSGDVTFTIHIGEETLFTQQHSVENYSATGSGEVDAVQEGDLCRVPWSSTWSNPADVQLVSQDQLLVDVKSRAFIPSDSQAPVWADGCHMKFGDKVFKDVLGFDAIGEPPTFSLKTTDTQQFDVSPASLNAGYNPNGHITWEITVKPASGN